MFNKVADINKKPDVSAAKAKQSATGANFSEYLSSAMTNQSSQVSSATSISVTNAIFAAQMVSDDETLERRRKALKRGNSLVDKLEEIRNSLLIDDLSTEKLIEISRFVKNTGEHVNDEKLSEIIAEIELRVEVELAKLETIIL